MFSPAIVGIIVLALMFVLASWRNINIGTLAFPAALLVGSYAGLSLDEQLSGFPVELFIVVVGITYLFGIAQANGTVEMILNAGVRLLRGHIALLPLLLFLLAFGISAIGAVGTATLAMTLPIALACGYRYRINVFMMAMVTTCGMQAGYFSPNAIYSNTVIQILSDAGFDISRSGLFLSHVGLNVAIAAGVYLFGGGIRLIRRGAVQLESEAVAPAVGSDSDQSYLPRSSSARPTAAIAESDGQPVDQSESVHARLFKWATIVALVLLFCGVLIIELDPGMLAISLGCLLMLVFASKEDSKYVAKVAWPTVLMLTGILTYVGVLEATGALTAVSEGLASIGDATTGILFISYISGIVSAVASSIGTMGAVIPLTTPLLAADPSLSVLGSTTAVTASTYLVDPSPMSILGALVLANARTEDQQSLFRKLLLWAVVMIVAAPALTWVVFVLPTWS